MELIAKPSQRISSSGEFNNLISIPNFDVDTDYIEKRINFLKEKSLISNKVILKCARYSDLNYFDFTDVRKYEKFIVEKINSASLFDIYLKYVGSVGDRYLIAKSNSNLLPFYASVYIELNSDNSNEFKLHSLNSKISSVSLQSFIELFSKELKSDTYRKGWDKIVTENIKILRSKKSSSDKKTIKNEISELRQDKKGNYNPLEDFAINYFAHLFYLVFTKNSGVINIKAIEGISDDDIFNFLVKDKSTELTSTSPQVFDVNLELHGYSAEINVDLLKKDGFEGKFVKPVNILDLLSKMKVSKDILESSSFSLLNFKMLNGSISTLRDWLVKFGGGEHILNDEIKKFQLVGHVTHLELHITTFSSSLHIGFNGTEYYLLRFKPFNGLFNSVLSTFGVEGDHQLSFLTRKVSGYATQGNYSDNIEAITSKSDYEPFHKFYLTSYPIIAHMSMGVPTNLKGTIGQVVNVINSDNFKRIAKEKNLVLINKFDFYLAVLPAQMKERILLLCVVNDLRFGALSIRDFRLSTQIEPPYLGSDPLAFSIDATYALKIDNKEHILVGKTEISTSGMYTTLGLDKDYRLELLDRFQLADVGFLIGIDYQSGVNIGVQGRLMAKNQYKAVSLFGAINFGVYGAKPLNMISFAIAPSTNENVLLSEVLAIVLNLDIGKFSPFLSSVGIQDWKLSSKNSGVKNPPVLTAYKNNEVVDEVFDNVVDYFNQVVTDDIKVNKLDVSVNTLEPKKGKPSFLLTDNTRKIHYRIDDKGQIYLNTQATLAIEEVTIGHMTYYRGVYSALNTTILGYNVKLLLAGDLSYVEAYAQFPHVKLFNFLEIYRSKSLTTRKPKDLGKMSPFFKSVIENVEVQNGPELYFSMQLSDLRNLNTIPFKFYFQGGFNLFGIFKGEAFIDIGEEILIDCQIELLNYKAKLYFKTESVGRSKGLNFALNLEGGKFAHFIEDQQKALVGASRNIQIELNAAILKFEAEKARYNREMAEIQKRADEKAKSEKARYDSMNIFQKAAHKIVNWGELAVNFFKELVVTVKKVTTELKIALLNGVSKVVQVGTDAFNALLSAVEKVVSLLNKVVSISKLILTACDSVDKSNLDFKLNVNAQFFGLNVNRDLNFTLGVDFSNEKELIDKIGQKLKSITKTAIESTDDYIKYIALGKDGSREHNPTSHDISKLTEHLKALVEKFSDSVEMQEYLKDMLANPEEFDAFVKEWNIGEEEVVYLKSLLSGNVEDCLEPLNAITSVFDSSEFKNNMNTIQKVVNKEFKLRKSRDFFNDIDKNLESISQIAKVANQTRVQIQKDRQLNREKQNQILDQKMAEIREMEYNLISDKLRKGEIKLASNEAKKEFQRYTASLRDPELIGLALAVIKDAYIH